MGYELLGRNRVFEWNGAGWCWILKLALDYGWSPKGTVLTFYQEYLTYGYSGQKNDPDFDPEYELMKEAIRSCAEWDEMDYFGNYQFQTVTRGDAQNLAAALEKALLDNDRSLSDELDYDRHLRDRIEDFIAFCREGEFRIF